MLKCKHFFHADCILSKIEQKWNPPNVSFEYLNCPACKTPIEVDHSDIEEKLLEDRKLEELVKEMAVKEGKKEYLDKEDYSKPPYNGKFGLYAVDKMAIYMCYECKNFYPAGKKECGGQPKKADECFCKECTFLLLGETKGVTDCSKHGNEFIVFK
mmetsp:Transcript_9190/g.10361  ORF Transcript_9190/g.10361 Transcript_9190/m.10361 type:complete len:156 (-) Transcript_9190:6-473(-)